MPKNGLDGRMIVSFVASLLVRAMHIVRKAKIDDVQDVQPEGISDLKR